MALIECYECEKEISDQAPACPHCGASKEGRSPEPVATKDERFNLFVAIAVGAFVLQIARELGDNNFSMVVSQAYGELAGLLVAFLIGGALLGGPAFLLTKYGKKQSPQAYARILAALFVVFVIAIWAGPIGVFIVLVLGGFALVSPLDDLRALNKQGETASPQVPTPSPVIRAKPQEPIPKYPHSPPAATSPPDDLVQQMSDSRPDQSQSSVLSCSKCGHENPAEVNFCTKCRAKMTLECNKCGFKSPQGSEFCGSCGEETEFRVEKRARNAALAAAEAAAWVREAEARTALIPVERYFDNGHLEVKGGTKGGKLHGLYERYYKNGQLRSRAIHKNGEKHGPYEYYDENGKLEYRGTYNMGSRCGTWIVDRKTVTYDPSPPGLEDGN
jgi:predicted RNA-binding Zn-ribbon protein involved in translation (DUF1610 family)